MMPSVRAIRRSRLSLFGKRASAGASAASTPSNHRRDTLRAEKILPARLFEHPKVTVAWNAVVEEIVGAGTPPVVTGVTLRDVTTDAARTLPVDGVFVAIGHTPNTAVFRGELALDGEGYVVTEPGSTRTSVPGVFAAGDVQDKVFR